MTRERTQRAAAVGVAEHGNSAVLVTVLPGGDSSIAGVSTSPVAACRRTRIITKARGRWAVT